MLNINQSRTLRRTLIRLRPYDLEDLIRSPTTYLARKFHGIRRVIPAQSPSPISIICISDTHGQQPDIPLGDVLIHAGDLTHRGTLKEIQACFDWLKAQPHQHKIVIGGNHDVFLDPEIRSYSKTVQTLDTSGLIYLQNGSATIECADGRTLKVFGSPMSPKFYGYTAFQYPREENVWENQIPDDVDILVTHGPPLGYRDRSFGCAFLSQEVWRTKPKLHVFGHIHEANGQQLVAYDDVERAYMAVVARKEGLFALLHFVYLFFVSFFHTPVRSHTQVVNAAMRTKNTTPIKVQI
ncbi:Metallo-dependent phosphatase [Eremomyces bilateralis CBS 781.70]|uniref:Metallo-dependent phosphatase n=1 Tax=Eremomyces bilateralis CBS 781.70 TaxID=1392243 RepID=A0A6G1G7A4_9PEZI|nr:Metallo-dependent phosphatase [Eremomyces bilateralis CBS 781.70]KAF1813780.1 Metallo-dependent phosphatase [Eremomyces bilateralis CBS 781.70]